jgi:aminoglycoside/choline kinase family phosphotransferase
MEDQRLNQLTDWLNTHNDSVQKIAPLAGDASFRRYFRVQTADQSFVAMDAPPQKENCDPFVNVAQDLRRIGVHTPQIHNMDLEQGFLLLSDFGDVVLNNILTAENVDHWYNRCFDELLLIQKHEQLPTYKLKSYNNGLYSYYEESSWFLTWYLQQYRQQPLKHTQLAEIEREIHIIAKAMLEQPQVVIHRDYHSRNIMVIGDLDIAVLDFQDAVLGPITYDLVSLLRDCYIDWPLEQVHSWVNQYHARLLEAGILTNCSQQQFLRWFDWTGLQRHLKCIGLFVRLNLRDNKPGYLQYIPRLINYIKQASQNHPELWLLNELMDTAASDVSRAKAY